MCEPKRIRLFELIINCTVIMKTISRVSPNVCAISDRIWCNKHLRPTTTEKYYLCDVSSLPLTAPITRKLDKYWVCVLKWLSVNVAIETYSCFQNIFVMNIIPVCWIPWTWAVLLWCVWINYYSRLSVLRFESPNLKYHSNMRWIPALDVYN